jgi:hypothetical protein
MTAVAALAAAAFVPPDDAPIPPALESAIRLACAGAWRAVEVVLAGDVLRGRLSKTRDAIVRDAVEGVLGLHGKTGIRADALASLRAAREAGVLDGPFDLASTIAAIRQQGVAVVGRAAVAGIRRELVEYRELEQVLADTELASLLLDAARAIFRGLARDPELTRWAIGPTGSPGRDRALAAFAELAASPESIAELDALIAIPIHLDDNVQFTVYRPRVIDPGKWHQLLAFAHLAERRPGEDDLPDPVEEVQRQAQAVLGDKAKSYQPMMQDAGAAIPEEGELTFVPEFPGIEVNPPRRSFLWLETVHREEFRIRAPRELDGKTVRGRVTVFLGHIAIAELAVSVRVDAARPEPTRREPTTARAYRKIFASYSHRDIEIVNQFETYARALGDEYLRDWVHLRTGEVWNDRLCQLIEQADAFQLFWSWNSMKSQFVRQEYEHALSLNRPSFVRPTYWEDPMPVAPGLPPDALLRLHFQKLGAAMLGDGGRTEVAVAKAKRAKQEAPDTMEVERERAPTTLSDTDQWGSETPIDSLTDPQFELPEEAASADRSATDLHVFEPPVEDNLRRRSANASASPAAPASMHPAPAPAAGSMRPAAPRPGPAAPAYRPAPAARVPAIIPRPAPSAPMPMAASAQPSRPREATSPAPMAAASIPSPGPAPMAAPSMPAPAARPRGPTSPAPMAAPSMTSASQRPSQPAPMAAPSMMQRPSPAPAPAPSKASQRPSQPPPVSRRYEPTTIKDDHEDEVIEPQPVVAPRRAKERPELRAGAAPGPGAVDRKQVGEDSARREPRIATNPGVGPSRIPHTSPHAAPPPPRPSQIACARCGHANPLDVAFCLYCGSDLVTPAPSPSPSKTMMADPMPIIALAETPVLGADLRPPAPSAPAPAPPLVGGAMAAPSPAPPIVGGPPPSHMVSPYAATMPQEAYNPAPDDPLFASESPDIKKRPSLPNAPAGSRWPLILIVLGILIVAGVMVFWLLRT